MIVSGFLFAIASAVANNFTAVAATAAAAVLLGSVAGSKKK